jgi:hypothetical protein
MSGTSTAASVFCSVVAFGRNCATKPLIVLTKAVSSAGPIVA